jgi:hypothetical protein
VFAQNTRHLKYKNEEVAGVSLRNDNIKMEKTFIETRGSLFLARD